MSLLIDHLTHEINNEMLTLSGNAELLSISLADQPDQAKRLEKILAAAQNIGQLVRVMEAAGDDPPSGASAFDLNEVIHSVCGDHPEWDEDPDRTLDLKPGDGLREIPGDPREGRFIIEALMINAFEAIETRGGVIMETGNQEIRQSQAGALSSLKSGRYVVLTVSDDGVGMTPETQSQIFQPFFTTKPSRHGYSLALVKRLLGKRGGGIEVMSRPNEGTRMKAYFPVAG